MHWCRFLNRRWDTGHCDSNGSGKLALGGPPRGDGLNIKFRALSLLRCIPWPLFFGVCLVAFVVGALGFHAVDLSWLRDAKMGAFRGERSSFAGLDFLQILLRNVGAALLLYSGVVTFGLTTLVGSCIIALYLGATMALAVHAVGVMGLLNEVIWYVPCEFLG